MVKVALGNVYGVVVKTIDLGNGESIELEIKRASLEEQLTALQEQSGVLSAARCRAMISGWRGVCDQEGKPVPYSWDALNRFCAIYENAIWAISSAVRDVVNVDPGQQETRSKNSESPPIAGGEATTTETTSSTPSSDTTSSGNASSDYATLSE